MNDGPMNDGPMNDGVLWVDASSGASGDMLLGALLSAGVPLHVLQDAVDAVSPEPATLRVETVSRGGFAATRCHVDVTDSVQHRTWRDIRSLLLESPPGSGFGEPVRDLALRVFERLAVAEAAVHGGEAMDVHFHEVGALDAIADVVGACAGLVHLGATQVMVSPVAVGSGFVRGSHGLLPVPPPAVAELLRGVPSYAGPEGAPAMELCTPTGAALLTTFATGWGPQPPMVTAEVGVGAGGRDPEGHANVLRLLVGVPVVADDGADDLLVLETNVDDLDPRVWPEVISAVLAAGALDAWLTPIVMKKGRPAHMLSALCRPDAVGEVQAAVFATTSTIGMRIVPVGKAALERVASSVEVLGGTVGVKLAVSGGRVVNVSVEFEDVAALARELGLPVKEALRAATAAAAIAHPAG
jgi:uncharacterized protein (TIGR00299 family) protein